MAGDNKDPSYPWYPRDHAFDELVQVLSLEEEGAHRRLLDHQWLHGSIPSEIPALACICKNTSVREMTKLWKAIAPLYHPLAGQDGRLYNRRLERIRQERKGYREKKSTAGKLGADAAWGEGESGQGKRYVYALQRTTGGPFKIGVSRSPSRRAKRLGEGLGAELVVVAQCEGGFGLERASQVELATHRVGTEWFADTPEVRHWITCHISTLAKPRHRLGSGQGEPSPALALASASALASPEKEISSSSSSSGKQGAAVPIDRTDYARRCTVACNRGLRENQHVNGFRELVTSNQLVEAGRWLDGRIPIDLAEQVVFDRSLAYEPAGSNKQPASLRYFRKPVEEAWERQEGRAQERRFVPREAKPKRSEPATPVPALRKLV